jgi:CYTH domain-containing protein
MVDFEYERTYLAKKVPGELANCDYEDITDIYFPIESDHPALRLRKRGKKIQLIKKTMISPPDMSSQIEQVINLDEKEYITLSQAPGKRLVKRRYKFPYLGRLSEIDVFGEELQGLVLIDFEFTSPTEKDNFSKPDFCLVEVTQDLTFAGGILCGKRYKDIEQYLLTQYDYKPLTLN